MVLSTLAQQVISAYGGVDAWTRAKAVEATVSAGGLAFRTKWRGSGRNLPRLASHVRAEKAEPRVRFDPIDRRGRVGVLDGLDVHIENANGKRLATRSDARSKFPYGRRILWWDDLDAIFFNGEALWNYLTFPALLLREDISWREIAANTLEARFPPNLPTHSEYQRFHFDPATRLLAQHDYTAEAFGSLAKVAQLILDHGNSDGVPFPSKRRVKVRRSDGQPRPWPLLIWIDIHEYHLV